jgi:ubiquinone biosynthesis protein Coq4
MNASTIAPLSTIKQRLGYAKALWGFVDLVRHPEHLDRVFELADSLASRPVIEKMRDHVAADAQGAAALRDKPRLAVRVDALASLPEGTLGRAFADHLKKNGLDPASIPSLPGSTDLEFVRAHLYETHDVWHAVTGFETDVAGELGLQSFYAAQMPGGLPLLLMAVGFLNAAFFATDEGQRRVEAVARGWQMGRRARPLFGVSWGELWARPLAEVRETLGVRPS